MYNLSKLIMLTARIFLFMFGRHRRIKDEDASESFENHFESDNKDIVSEE